MTDDRLPDDEIEINLRPPREVGGRILNLAALCRRAYLETIPAAMRDDAEADAERFDLLAWLEDEGIGVGLTAEEHRLLSTPVGGLSLEVAEAASWNVEGAMALAWSAMFIPELPPVGQVFDPAPILTTIPQPWEPTPPFLASITLRTEEEIAIERERVELWLWRTEIEQTRISARGADRSDLDAAIGQAAVEAYDLGLIGPPVADDFAADGRAYPALDADTQAAITSVAYHRLYALNWLCGFGGDWSDVPLDV